MKEILNNIQAELKTVLAIKYLDQDWGQLDYYSPNMPVKFPAVLLDVSQSQYTNIGRDFNAQPQNRQQAQAQLTITIANLRLSNTSANAPDNQRDYTMQIWALMEDIHKKLHGFIASDTASALIRLNMQRSNRDDGIQQYKLTYTFAISNI